MNSETKEPAGASTRGGAHDQSRLDGRDSQDIASSSQGQSLPIVVAEWEKGRRGETIRVTLDRYGGHPTIDVRKWWPDDSGELRPSRSGLTLGIKHLRQLADGLAAALVEAELRGLVEGADGEE